MTNSLKIKLGCIFTLLISLLVAISTYFVANHNFSLNNNKPMLSAASNVRVEGFKYETVRDGTIWNLVETVEDLQNINKNLSANYKLMADIDLKSNTSNGGYGWLPIGWQYGVFVQDSKGVTYKEKSPFMGVFNGNGYSIKNLTIMNGDWQLFSKNNAGVCKNAYQGRFTAFDYYFGLFSSLKDATIYDLCILDPTIQVYCRRSAWNVNGEIDLHDSIRSTYCGALAGSIEGGTNNLSQIYVKNATLSVANKSNTESNGGDTWVNNIGGIIGGVFNCTSITLQNCAVNNTVSEEVSFGNAKPIPSNISAYSYAYNNTYQSLSRNYKIACGGLIGWIENTSSVLIKDCYANSNLYNYYDLSLGVNTWGIYHYTGGLVGCIEESTASFDGCFAITQNNTKHFIDHDQYHNPSHSSNGKYRHDFQPIAGLKFNNKNDSVNKLSYNNIYYFNQSNEIYNVNGNSNGFNGTSGYNSPIIEVKGLYSKRAGQQGADTFLYLACAITAPSVSWFNTDAGFSSLGWDTEPTTNTQAETTATVNKVNYSTTEENNTNLQQLNKNQTASVKTYKTEATNKETSKLTNISLKNNFSIANRPMVNLFAYSASEMNNKTGLTWQTKTNEDGVVCFAIDSAEKLRAIDTDEITLSQNYILTDDIDLSRDSKGYTSTYGWTPIGGTIGFSGLLDGDGHSIENLKILSNAEENGKFYNSIEDFPHDDFAIRHEVGGADINHGVVMWVIIRCNHAYKFYLGLFSKINNGMVKDVLFVEPKISIRTAISEYAKPMPGSQFKQGLSQHFSLTLNHNVEAEIFAGVVAGYVSGNSILTGIYVKDIDFYIDNGCHSEILSSDDDPNKVTENMVHYTVVGGLVGLWEASSKQGGIFGCAINDGSIYSSTALGYRTFSHHYTHGTTSLEADNVYVNDRSEAVCGGLIGWRKGGDSTNFITIKNNYVYAKLGVHYNRGGDQECNWHSYVAGIVAKDNINDRTQNNFVVLQAGSNSENNSGTGLTTWGKRSIICTHANSNNKNNFYLNPSSLTSLYPEITIIDASQSKYAGSKTNRAWFNSDAGLKALGWDENTVSTTNSTLNNKPNATLKSSSVDVKNNLTNNTSKKPMLTTKQNNLTNRPMVNLFALSEYSMNSKTGLSWKTKINEDGIECFVVDSIKKLRAIETDEETLRQNYILEDDIDLSKDNSNGEYGWKPIGKWNYSKTDIVGFSGLFDGDGHTISGLNITSKDGKVWGNILGSFPGEMYKSGDTFQKSIYVGLFAKIENATIKNLELKDVKINIALHKRGDGNHAESLFCGAVAGIATGSSTLSSISLKNSFVVGSVSYVKNTCYSIVGGLVGKCDDITVDACAINNEDFESNVFYLQKPIEIGAMGYASNGNNYVITICGGLIGQVTNFATINNNYIYSNICNVYHPIINYEDSSCYSYLGGLVGFKGRFYNPDNHGSNYWNTSIDVTNNAIMFKDNSFANNDSKQSNSLLHHPICGNFDEESYTNGNFYYSNSLTFGENGENLAGVEHTESLVTNPLNNNWINEYVFANSNSGMRQNADPNGLPIPSAFAYKLQIDLTNNSLDNEKGDLLSVVKNEGFIKDGDIYTHIKYYEKDTSFSCSETSSFGGYDRISIGDGPNTKTLNLSFWNYAYKKYKGDSKYIFDGINQNKLGWNAVSSDGNRYATISINTDVFKPYRITVSTEKLYLKTGAKQFTEMNFINYIEEHSSAIDNGLRKNDANAFLNLTYTDGNPTIQLIGNGVISELFLTVKSGYKVTGLCLKNYTGNSSNSTVNIDYYQPDGYPAEQLWYLVIDYSTIDVKIYSDTGGDTKGKLPVYNADTKVEQESEVYVEGKGFQHPNTDSSLNSMNHKDYTLKQISNIKVMLHPSFGTDYIEQTGSGKIYHFYVNNIHDGYKFDKFIIKKNGQNATEDDYILNQDGTYLLTLNDNYDIAFCFEPINYGFYLWEEKAKFADTEKLATKTTDDKFGAPKNNLIQFNIEKSWSQPISTFAPTSDEGGNNTTDQGWVISIRNNQVVGNSSLNVNINEKGKTITLSKAGEGKWIFEYSSFYVDVNGNTNYLISKILSGSWGYLDIGVGEASHPKDLTDINIYSEYSTYTLYAFSVKKYNLNVVNNGEGLWTQEGLNKNNNNLLMGVGGNGGRFDENTLIISAFNAFPFFSTVNTSGNGLAFYKSAEFSAQATNYKEGNLVASLYKGGIKNTITNEKSCYYVYNFGYEINSWTISLKLKSSFTITINDKEFNEFYFKFDGNEWILFAKTTGNEYFTKNLTDAWARLDSFSIENLKTPIANLTAEGNKLASNADIMLGLCKFIDKIFAVNNKDEIFKNAAFSMVPGWQAVKINVVNNNNNANVFKDKNYINYGDAYAFDETKFNLRGSTFAYLYKKVGDLEVYCVNNAQWNYINADHNFYNYSTGYYTFNVSTSNIKAVSNIYKVNLNGDNVNWGAIDVTGDNNYCYGFEDIYKLDSYNYTSNIFNFVSYNNSNRFWAEEYYQEEFKNYLIAYDIYVKQANFDSFKLIKKDASGYENKDDNVSTQNKKHGLLFRVFYNGSNQHYIYLTNVPDDSKTNGYPSIFNIIETTSTGYKSSNGLSMPVFERTTAKEYYKLNYWDAENASFTTYRYKSDDGATNKHNTKYWSLTNGLNLTAHYHREWYNLTVQTILENKISRVGYALLYFEDKIDPNEEGTALYLAIAKNGNMNLYAIDKSFISIDSTDNIITNNPNNKFILNNNFVDNKGSIQVKFFSGCDIYVLAFDQSQDPTSMNSGNFDDIIGHKFNIFSGLSSTISAPFGFENGKPIVSINLMQSGFSAYLNEKTLITAIKQNPNIATAHTFKIELMYQKINYNLGILLNNDYNGHEHEKEKFNPGTFSLTNGKDVNRTGLTEYDLNNLKVGDLEYVIKYYAGAGYEFQDNAFSLIYLNGGHTLKDINMLSQDDGSFGEQDYAFNFYGTWLRENYYKYQNSNYEYQNNNIGDIYVNTKEIDFTLGIKYLNLDNNVYFTNDFIDENKTLIKKDTESGVQLLNEHAVPYGATEQTMNGKEAYVFTINNVTYALVKTFAYQPNLPNSDSVDYFAYNLPYFVDNKNNKTFQITNNFGSRVVIPGNGGIINANNRIIYYTFAVRELLELQVQVAYPDHEMNNSNRQISISNILRQDNNNTYRRLNNKYTLVLGSGGASFEDGYYQGSKNISATYAMGSDYNSCILNNNSNNLLTYYTYQGLSNTLTHNLNEAYNLRRYKKVTFTYINAEESRAINSGSFVINKSGTLLVEFEVKPLDINIMYTLKYFPSADADELSVINNISLLELIERGVINPVRDGETVEIGSPYIQFINSSTNKQPNQAFVDESFFINMFNNSTNSNLLQFANINFKFSCKIGNDDSETWILNKNKYNSETFDEILDAENAYKVLADLYNKEEGIIINYIFTESDGKTIHFDFRIANQGEDDYVVLPEEEIVGKYNLEILEGTTPAVSSTNTNIANDNKIYRVVEGRTVAATFNLNAGYYYVGYKKDGAVNIKEEEFKLPNFTQQQSGNYIIYLKRNNVNVNLVMADDANEQIEYYKLSTSLVDNDFEFIANNNISTQANNSIYVLRKQTPKDDLLKYYIKLSEEETLELTRDGNTGLLNIDSNLLSKLNKDENDNYNITIFVEHTHNYTLTFDVEGENYLSEGSGVVDGSYKPYSTYLVIKEGETERYEEIDLLEEEADGSKTNKYFDVGTKIKVNVNLFKTNKYDVEIWQKLNGKKVKLNFDEPYSELEFIVELTEDKNLEIVCNPKVYNISTNAQIYNTLTELNANQGTAFDTPDYLSYDSKYNTKQSVEYLLQRDVNNEASVLTYITLKVDNDLPLVKIILDANKQIVKQAIITNNNNLPNAKAQVVNGTIVITWGEDDLVNKHTYIYNYEFANNVNNSKVIRLEFITTNVTTIQLDYLDYKAITQI